MYYHPTYSVAPELARPFTLLCPAQAVSIYIYLKKINIYAATGDKDTPGEYDDME